jgi:prepilin-type N-terminal cleavage/methylation domain-containing protein
MQALEKNIKGFNILEVVVVLVIVGVISAAAYPKFTDWKKKREIRDTALKVKSLMLGINAQVQRGLYSFVQVYVNVEDTEITFTSKGMKSDTLNTKINNGDDIWNTDSSSRCNISSTTYWDDDGAVDNKLEVQTLVIDRQNITTNFDGEAAVCFSKNARWYSGAGSFVSGTGSSMVVDGTMFLCIRPSDVNFCAVDESTGKPTIVVENLYSVDWTRFGDVTLDKWSSISNEWVSQ